MNRDSPSLRRPKYRNSRKSTSWPRHWTTSQADELYSQRFVQLGSRQERKQLVEMCLRRCLQPALLAQGRDEWRRVAQFRVLQAVRRENAPLAVDQPDVKALRVARETVEIANECVMAVQQHMTVMRFDEADHLDEMGVVVVGRKLPRHGRILQRHRPIGNMP